MGTREAKWNHSSGSGSDTQPQIKAKKRPDEIGGPISLATLSDRVIGAGDCGVIAQAGELPAQHRKEAMSRVRERSYPRP